MLRIFKKKFADFQEFKFFYKIKNLHNTFFIFIIHKPSLWSHDVPQKNFGPIGSVVLTFIGYKQIDKPNLYIDIFSYNKAFSIKLKKMI